MMGSTYIPTMSLRYVRREVQVSGQAIGDTRKYYETKLILQQRLDKVSGGFEWRDVPIGVEDD